MSPIWMGFGLNCRSKVGLCPHSHLPSATTSTTSLSVASIGYSARSPIQGLADGPKSSESSHVRPRNGLSVKSGLTSMRFVSQSTGERIEHLLVRSIGPFEDPRPHPCTRRSNVTGRLLSCLRPIHGVTSGRWYGRVGCGDGVGCRCWLSLRWVLGSPSGSPTYRERSPIRLDEPTRAVTARPDVRPR